MLIIWWLLSGTAIAAEDHWARDQIEEMKAKGVSFCQEPDVPASVHMQKEVFGLAGISLQPREDLNRYTLIQAMLVNMVGAEGEAVNEADIPKLLEEYADYCKYCIKANMILGRAVKSGLLKGRLTASGKRLEPKSAVTGAELAVFASRFLEMHRIKNRVKN